jgi:hypothetical protein
MGRGGSRRGASTKAFFPSRIIMKSALVVAIGISILLSACAGAADDAAHGTASGALSSTSKVLDPFVDTVGALSDRVSTETFTFSGTQGWTVEFAILDAGFGPHLTVLLGDRKILDQRGVVESGDLFGRLVLPESSPYTVVVSSDDALARNAGTFHLQMNPAVDCTADATACVDRAANPVSRPMTCQPSDVEADPSAKACF